MPPKQPTVLLVDDEEMVTTTLSAYLTLETDYHILTYQSPTQALRYLQRSPVDLVITDFLMPEMDGLHFLFEVQKLYPEMPIILLTGYADKRSAIKAINEVNLFQYVEKPWDNEHMKLIIRNALRHKTLKAVLQSKISELNGLLREREKLMQQHEMLREELALAREVQQSMLPGYFPEHPHLQFVAHYHPALEIGGDFYDTIPLADGKIGVLIADVTGHGIQAALITVLLKSAFAEWRDEEISPRDMLVAFNTLLFRVLPTNIFVAALILVLDSETNACQLANSGIPHPFHVKRNAGEVQRIPANGLLLGIADEDTFMPGEERTFQLERGDKLLFYTDGLSEIEGQDQRQFENQIVPILLKTLDLPAGRALEALEKSARAFSKPGHNWDDMTLLAIEVTSE